MGEILRADESTRAIAVFALSANAMRSDVEQGLAAGFDGYLTKPVNIPWLLDRPRATLGR